MTTTQVNGLVEISDSHVSRKALDELTKAWWANEKVTITVNGHTYPLHVTHVEVR